MGNYFPKDFQFSSDEKQKRIINQLQSFFKEVIKNKAIIYFSFFKNNNIDQEPRASQWLCPGPVYTTCDSHRTCPLGFYILKGLLHLIIHTASTVIFKSEGEVHSHHIDHFYQGVEITSKLSLRKKLNGRLGETLPQKRS